jgi:phosphoserine phosphatase
MSSARSKCLLVFDVEGTLFETKVRLQSTALDSTIWQALAQTLGPEAVAAEIETHQRWRRGEYSSYLAWMEDTIRIHKKFGLTRSIFQQIISLAAYNSGVAGVLSNIDRERYVVVLVSGGFRELAARVQQDFQIHHAFAACEYFFGAEGSLDSYNLLPCDFEGKLDFIKLMLREYQLSSQDWIFIGDGANDVPIAKAAPLSIAFRGHPDLREVASFYIDDFSKIMDILRSLRSATDNERKGLLPL